MKASKKYESTHKRKRAYSHEYYVRNKEAILKSARRWQEKNKSKLKEYRRLHNKKWYQNNKEKSKENYRKYRLRPDFKVKARAYVNEYNYKLRERAILLLGGRCVKCGFSDHRALQFDHINGGGNRERNSGIRAGAHLHRRVLKGNHEGLQLLCANCNWIKRYENNELHHL